MEWCIPQLFSKFERQLRNMSLCNLFGGTEISCETTHFTTHFYTSKWVAEDVVPQFILSLPNELRNNAFYNISLYPENSCRIQRSLIIFFRKETHFQITNLIKSFQISYKSFNISCFIVQCDVIKKLTEREVRCCSGRQEWQLWKKKMLLSFIMKGIIGFPVLRIF